MLVTFPYKTLKFAMEIADKCNFRVDIFHIVNDFKSFCSKNLHHTVNMVEKKKWLFIVCCVLFKKKLMYCIW